MTSQPDRREPVDAYLNRIFAHNEARVLQDPEIAHEVAKRLEAEPLAEGVHAPITTALPVGLPPVEYVIHVWTHKCSMCQTEHKHSEVYGVNHLRSRTGAGQYVRNMTPVSRLEWQVPIRVIPITTRITAGCFECFDALRDTILPTLPRPPVPEAVAKGYIEGTEGASTADKRRPTPAKPSSRYTSTDDFLI